MSNANDPYERHGDVPPRPSDSGVSAAALHANAFRPTASVRGRTVRGVPLIAQSLIDRYAAGPSATRVTEVQRLHQRIRSVLGDASYDTFLQGSYRNDTAIANINDVDIVALSRTQSSPQSNFQWDQLFGTIERTLRASYLISGGVSRGDKCITISGTPSADVVPAIRKGAITSDPIAIYSFRQRSERDNYPRVHYSRGVDKNKPLRTNGAYKPTVRLFKRWVRQYSDHAKIAPSFYIECAVHKAADAKFDTYLPLSFAQVALEICSWTRNTVILSVAGDKDVLLSTEWQPERFEAFQSKLLRDVNFVVRALNATTATEANRLWKLAFGDTT
jgi:hypothetical protein